MTGKMSDAGLNMVKGFEGYHLARPDGGCDAYLCPAGVWTIGWGCTEGIVKGMVWTKATAEQALRNEMKRFEHAVDSMVKVPLQQNQYDALVSFAYNVGEGALKKSTLLKKVNAGDFAGAANEFQRWNKGGGKVLPGLTKRRAAEAKLFRGA